MKHPNMQALAAAVTLAGAVFFNAPGAAAQEPPKPAQPAATPAGTPATQPAATPAATPTAETPPAQTPPPSVVRPAPPPPPVQRKITLPIVVSGAIGGAALASGIVFGILAAGDNSKYKQTPDNEVALSGEQNAFISDVSFGVAALFGLTAIFLYLLPDEPTPEAPKAAEPPKAAARSWVTHALKGEVLSF